MLGLQSHAANQASLLQEFSQELADLRWDGPLPLLLRRINEETVQKNNLKHIDGERRLTNWRQIGGLLQNEWFAGRHVAGELAQWMKRAMGSPSSEDDENMMKLETDLPAVQLVTIHSSKGLEYPIVFCPFLWSLPSLSKKNQRPLAVLRTPSGTILDLGSDDFLENRDLSITQEDEELQRLLYVSLTRARHRVYLGLAPVDAGGAQHANGAENSPLAKLLGLSGATKDQWRARLNELPVAVIEKVPVRKVPGAESIPQNLADLPPVPAAVQSLPPRAEVLALGECPEPFVQKWNSLRCTSYSSLSRSAHEAETLSVRDHDEETAPASGTSKEGLLKGLGSGISLGKEIHKVLEEILGNRMSIEAVLNSRQSWSSPEWKNAVETILSAPLTLEQETIKLRDVAGIAEMHFMIPSRGKFSPKALSKALLSDLAISENPSRRAWAEGLASWSFADLHGYLQGYMDLVFEHNGRWYVVDYKSNQLPGYQAGELERAMLESHYLLQSRLYTLALHRHLRATLHGYEYKKHIGGTAWLFLRGFPNEGGWFDRPTEHSITQLDQLFKDKQP